MKIKTRHRWLLFLDELGSRLFLITRKSAYDLLEILLFALMLGFIAVVASPVNSAVLRAITPRAREGVWVFVAGAIVAFALIGWVTKSHRARRQAAMLGLWFWGGLSITSFSAGGLWLMGTWTATFSVASALCYWRAGDDL